MLQGPFRITVASCCAEQRLDQYLVEQFPHHSRAYWARLARSGQVLVNGRPAKAGCRLHPADLVSGTLPDPRPVGLKAEAIALDVLYEDADLIVVNKPAAMVVHPAPGHCDGTLVNALLYHCPDLGPIGGEIRPGIVHRLDKDTSGVMVAAKNDGALVHLAAQFKKRRVVKTYLAVVRGLFQEETGRIELAIGRHPVDRKKMSTRSRRARDAVSLWRVQERYAASCLVMVNLMTGRTHQIRVHCAASGHPVLGDRVYGDRVDPLPSTAGLSVPRQMLHAWRLEIIHPVRDVAMRFEAPPPADMLALIEALRNKAGSGFRAATSFDSGVSVVFPHAQPL